ncbi:pyridoxal phosphate-dependent decarboxylase family protein [Kutzneria sp. CA-103260]|uniref:pyridoxal phosphate-dependent decarboxylase family protein n=1 Tax=Kutzneria sp. CA-103260 TaxID=2802641 RepID=UPI001BA85E76|nr:pyridoxal-dependent decarboxylase [Kutzneria sp. CA-103260]QUQ65185.1 amino acid decarboxylase [Kutzneria sp. CA-103260]
MRTLVEHGQPGFAPSTSGRYFDHVTGGSHPIGLAADWLTSVWGQGGASHETSLLTTVVEEVCAKWLTELFGLRPNTSVGVTSGYATANLTALAAARHHVLAQAGRDVEADGPVGAPEVRVLVSEGCHITVQWALGLVGLAGGIRPVPCDDQGRMRVDALAALLEKSNRPLIVCGQVGHMDTGASDDVARVAMLTHRHGGWLHLDASYGMWAAASPRHHPHALRRADSWATDAHKWLNVPYDCGIVLCAHLSAYQAALRGQADYPFDYPPERSRRARPLVLWATLRHLGVEGVIDLVDRSCRHARGIARRLADEPGITVLNEVVLNQVLVRFGDSDEHTDEVIEALHDSGNAFAGGTTWRGQRALRVSVCNWQTTEADCLTLTDTLITAHRVRSRALAGQTFG